MKLSCVVNGEKVEADITPRLLLSDFIRHELRLTGTHVGCEVGVCGACTIILDGASVRSCLIFAAPRWETEQVGHFHPAAQIVGPSNQSSAAH